MIKRMVIMLILVVAVIGGVFGYKFYQFKTMMTAMAAMGAPAQSVTTITAAESQWQPHFEAVGSLRAAKGVDLSSEVSGIVEAINFDSGGDVKAGDMLVQLRAEDDAAKLNALQAAADLAQTTYDRDEKQFKVQAISKETLDTDAAALQSAQAQVAEQQAVVDKKTIKAPFDGHLGIRQVDLGQYLNPGSPIVTLQALDPMYLDFYLPQQALSQVKAGQKASVKTDAWPARMFDAQISAIDPKVDTQTRNVQVRAEIANPDHALLPGMYATIDIDTGAPESHITLPQTAITYNPYGDTVYLAESGPPGKDGKPTLAAKQSFVTLGETRGDQVAVLTGLKAGDVVVTSGQLKLRNGAPIVVNNDVTPSNDAHPTPSEDQK